MFPGPVRAGKCTLDRVTFRFHRALSRRARDTTNASPWLHLSAAGQLQPTAYAQPGARLHDRSHRNQARGSTTAESMPVAVLTAEQKAEATGKLDA